MSNPEERLVEINHLKKYFHVNKGLLHAVDDVSFILTRARHWDLLENPAAESLPQGEPSSVFWKQTAER